MHERRLQFAVGLMMLVAMSIGSALVIRFGDLSREMRDRYPLVIHLETAGGLYPTAPVLLSGLSIGTVKSLAFDPDGGVLVTAEIQTDVKLRSDSVPIVARSLLGETVIEFVPGRSGDFLAPGSRVNGQGASDPLAAVARLEGRAVAVLDAFAETSREWQKVAANVNGLMETHEGQLDVVIERAAQSLHQFTQTMQSANQIISDPRTQLAMKETLTSLPQLVEDTRQTINATRGAVENINRNLVNLAQVTEPVGKRGPVLVARLESSLASLDSLLSELNQLSHAVNTPNGSIQKFAADPALYDNLNRSAQSLAILLKNLDPVMLNMREFSDKVARNPELMGVGGAIRPSTGLRDSDLLNHQPAVAPPAPRTAPSGRTAIRSQNGM